MLAFAAQRKKTAGRDNLDTEKKIISSSKLTLETWKEGPPKRA